LRTAITKLSTGIKGIDVAPEDIEELLEIGQLGVINHPHCIEKNGERICYVSALEYPEKDEALEVLGGNGFFAHGLKKVTMKYAGRKNVDGDDQWSLSDAKIARINTSRIRPP